MIKIAIHSVPRSGSTWVGNIFNSHPKVNFNFQPLFSYALKDCLADDSSKEIIDNFFIKLRETNDPFIKQHKNIERGIIPEFKKELNQTHVVYKEVRYHNILNNLMTTDSDVIVIGLIRNPFATISSWLDAPKEFRKELGWIKDDEWLDAPQKNMGKKEEFNGYNKWKEVTRLFLKLKASYPQRFYILNYDDLLENLNEIVLDLFKFCDLSMTTQTSKFLHNSTSKNNLDSYSVFKKKENDDSWKSNLSPSIIKQIKEDVDFKELNSIFNWI